MAHLYVHGYSDLESTRLHDQAGTLMDLLHHDSVFPPGSRVLEPGCGTGAQTLILARQNPACEFVSIEISGKSVHEAREKISAAGLRNVIVRQGDIMHLHASDGLYDHAVICFVLEHLADPRGTLAHVKTLIRPGGSITVIEGDHGLVALHPDSPAARKAIQCQISLQTQKGGDACIGRKLYPLLMASGFSGVTVSPRMVYVDASRPDLVDGFIKKTFTAMIEGVRDDAISGGMISPDEWADGIEGLLRTMEPDGTFCYLFFKGTGFTEDL